MEVQLSVHLKPIRVPNFVILGSKFADYTSDNGPSADIADLPDSVLVQLADEFKKNLLEHARVRRLGRKPA